MYLLNGEAHSQLGIIPIIVVGAMAGGGYSIFSKKKKKHCPPWMTRTKKNKCIPINYKEGQACPLGMTPLPVSLASRPKKQISKPAPTMGKFDAQTKQCWYAEDWEAKHQARVVGPMEPPPPPDNSIATAVTVAVILAAITGGALYYKSKQTKVKDKNTNKPGPVDSGRAGVKR